MSASIPEFGLAVAGRKYVLRPGSYGVIRDRTESIAVVRTPEGLFLPGGGQEAGESPEAALVREVAEECGLAIHILDFLGIADELVFSPQDGQFFRKRGSFFTAAAPGPSEELASEPDHHLVWLSPVDCLSQLLHESHKWAVRLASQASR